MTLRIEDYALIGDTHTAALVGRNGSIDWLCLPRLDSDACFAALLGDWRHGHWSIAPAGAFRTVRRGYRGDTLVLETELATDGGAVRVIDCMLVRGERPVLIRLVEGIHGRVRMRGELALRFDYGRVRPRIRIEGRRVRAVVGPDTVFVDADVAHELRDGRCLAEFEVAGGDRVGFRLAWSAPRQGDPPAFDAVREIQTTERWWRDWAAGCAYTGDYREQVLRSLITLKALSYAPSGGIAAAVTTSLPEKLGGTRNWDYRYCWIRDATFTLMALLDAGYADEAAAWREWLLRALGGEPERIQILYGVEGERRLPESELDWLPGYAGSRPVRIGNSAATQFQLDVYGELMDALHQARVHGIPPDPQAWEVQRELMDFLESHWRDPDNGLWEMRGPRRHFTHSKVMAWVAVDRAIQAVEHYEVDGPLDGWKRLRADIHDEVCERGYDGRAFTQYYGSSSLDASVLLIPAVGFLPADDPRMESTVAAIEKHLCEDGFVMRYTMDDGTDEVDDLPAGEGAFLACSFWLADNYILRGRVEEGRALFERLLELSNDVGLLSEEYDPHARRLVGNVPQAFSHVALINTAHNLANSHGPAHRRSATAAHYPQ